MVESIELDKEEMEFTHTDDLEETEDDDSDAEVEDELMNFPLE